MYATQGREAEFSPFQQLKLMQDIIVLFEIAFGKPHDNWIWVVITQFGLFVWLLGLIYSLL